MSAPGCLKQTQDLFHPNTLYLSIKCTFSHSCFQVVLLHTIAIYSYLVFALKVIEPNTG